MSGSIAIYATIQQVTCLKQVQELLGHQTIAMTMR